MNRRAVTSIVLLGVLIAGILYDRINLAPEPDPLPYAPRSLTPVLDDPTPLSSSWFCPVGSATTEGLIVEDEVTITNIGDEDGSARIDLVTPEGAGGSIVLELPANASTQFVPSSVATSEVVGTVIDIVGVPGVVSHRVLTAGGSAAGTCASATSETWYFADAVTTRDATSVIALLNPFSEDVVFSMSFQTSTRTREPEDLRAAVVPGHSILLVDVGEYVSREPNVAVSINTVQGRLAAERLQVFNGELGPVGATLQAGATDAALSWTFPAGRVPASGESRVVVFNPNEAVAQFDIEFILDPADRAGFGLVPLEASAQPGRQVVFDLVELFATYDIPVPYDVGIRVVSADGNPIVAERWSATPPIDETLIGAGGSEARLAPIRQRQTDPEEPDATEPESTEPEATEPEATEPDATEPEATEPEATEPEQPTGDDAVVDGEDQPVEEEGVPPLTGAISEQPTIDRGVTTSHGSELAAENWVIPWITSAHRTEDGLVAEGSAPLTYVIVAGAPDTLIELEPILAGERLSTVRSTIPASGIGVVALPTLSTDIAAVVRANAPVVVEVQLVVPGDRAAVLPAVPVLDAAAREAAEAPAGDIESELPDSVIDLGEDSEVEVEVPETTVTVPSDTTDTSVSPDSTATDGSTTTDSIPVPSSADSTNPDSSTSDDANTTEATSTEATPTESSETTAPAETTTTSAAPSSEAGTDNADG